MGVSNLIERQVNKQEASAGLKVKAAIKRGAAGERGKDTARVTGKDTALLLG